MHTTPACYHVAPALTSDLDASIQRITSETQQLS
jgi:hypothetical protein